MRSFLPIALFVCFVNLGIQCAQSEPLGDAFCARLRSTLHDPTPNKIYFDGSNGPTELVDGQSIRRGQTNLYFFHKSSDENKIRAGAIVVKIKYAQVSPVGEDHVILFNNRKTVSGRCKVPGIERYERFHGSSEEPNTCLKKSFHQGYSRGDPPFRTLKPTERRREFVFGAPGEDTRAFNFVLLDVAKNIFEFPKKIFSGGGDVNPPDSKTSYRSQIFNYTGTADAGSCIRFVLFSDKGDKTADIDVVDLLEPTQNEFVRAGVRNISFIGN